MTDVILQPLTLLLLSGTGWTGQGPVREEESGWHMRGSLNEETALPPPPTPQDVILNL